MPRAIIFDLDGTLVDSLEDIGAAMNEALVEQGHAPHPLEDYRRFVGDGVHGLAERALPASGDRDATVALFRRRYAARLLATTRPYGGIPELLDALVARGVPMSVVTNKPEPAARELMMRLFARWPWAAVVGDRPGLPKKPDPTGALEAARAMRVAPADTLFLGDTDTDMRTAHAAGMVPVGALWGFRPRAELEAARARHLIGAPGDALALM
jgi:phosphoglycolate phosphatase